MHMYLHKIPLSPSTGLVSAYLKSWTARQTALTMPTVVVEKWNHRQNTFGNSNLLVYTPTNCWLSIRLKVLVLVDILVKLWHKGQCHYLAASTITDNRHKRIQCKSSTNIDNQLYTFATILFLCSCVNTVAKRWTAHQLISIEIPARHFSYNTKSDARHTKPILNFDVWHFGDDSEWVSRV